MKIVIEGTPEECADAIRRLAPPQDIKPVFVPKREPSAVPFPYIGDYPPPVPLDTWSPSFGGTRIVFDGATFKCS